MDKIKSLSVCDMENNGFWCDLEWRKGLVVGEGKRTLPGGSQLALSRQDPHFWDASPFQYAWVQFPGCPAA